MVKGCQKKMIHIKDTKSRYYEEAYFVLRPGVGDPKVLETSMIDEAMKIARESIPSAVTKKRRRRAVISLLPFLVGVFVGAAVSALLFAVCLL